LQWSCRRCSGCLQRTAAELSIACRYRLHFPSSMTSLAPGFIGLVCCLGHLLCQIFVADYSKHPSSEIDHLVALRACFCCDCCQRCSQLRIKSRNSTIDQILISVSVEDGWQLHEGQDFSSANFRTLQGQDFRAAHLPDCFDQARPQDSDQSRSCYWH
jgi:hypothetical protein